MIYYHIIYHIIIHIHMDINKVHFFRIKLCVEGFLLFLLHRQGLPYSLSQSHCDCAHLVSRPLLSPSFDPLPFVDTKLTYGANEGFIERMWQSAETCCHGGLSSCSADFSQMCLDPAAWRPDAKIPPPELETEGPAEQNVLVSCQMVAGYHARYLKMDGNRGVLATWSPSDCSQPGKALLVNQMAAAGCCSDFRRSHNFFFFFFPLEKSIFFFTCDKI